MKRLEDKRVAILATDGFEQSELFSPYQALIDKGAEVHIISDQKRSIKAWDQGSWGKSVNVKLPLDEADVSNYDALVLPGGVMNPDRLRMNETATSFVREFFKQHKPVAAICHAPQMLINAEVVENRKLTGYPSIRKDLENAGAEWLDQSVVVDQGLVSSRSPRDLDDFNSKIIEEIYEGKHQAQVADA